MKKINGIIAIRRTTPIITTRNIKRKELLNKTVQMLFVLIIACLLLTPIGGCSNVQTEEYVRYVSFSPDGKKIIFDRRKGDSPDWINVYDLESGELTAYQPPSKEEWTMARYSFDGKYIVFSSIPRGEKYLKLGEMQIAVMTPDGRNVRRITNSPGAKIYPSFSHSGKKIIFVKAGKIRERGKTPATDYDIYEVDIETGKETRLTWFKFFMMSAPYYFPNDETFIFSAESPGAYPDLPDGKLDVIKKRREEYKSKYKENKILIMHGGEKTLKPYIELGQYSSRPLLSADGKQLFFQGDGEPQTRGGWEQFYLYSQDGNHRRITIQGKSVWSGAVSPDGSLLAVVYNRGIIFIYRINDGTYKEISLPDKPSKVIVALNERRNSYVGNR